MKKLILSILLILSSLALSINKSYSQTLDSTYNVDSVTYINNIDSGTVAKDVQFIFTCTDSCYLEMKFEGKAVRFKAIKDIQTGYFDRYFVKAFSIRNLNTNDLMELNLMFDYDDNLIALGFRYRENLTFFYISGVW